MLDLFCSLVLLTIPGVVAALYAARVSRKGVARSARVDRAGSSLLLGRGPMEMGYWAIRPMARLCVILGVTANAVSWTSLGLAAVAGAALALGHFGIGAVLCVASSVGDALDGLVARETGTASDAGEILDAAVDRYAELFVLSGIALRERSDALALAVVLAAIAGSVMVSYATAKAQALAVEAPRGAMRREERALYLALGVALVPVFAFGAGRWAMSGQAERIPILSALALVGAIGNASAIRRLRSIALLCARPDGAPDANAPHLLARNDNAAAGSALR